MLHPVMAPFPFAGQERFGVGVFPALLRNSAARVKITARWKRHGGKRLKNARLALVL